MISLIDRTKYYALRVIRLYSSLPKSSLAQILGKQLVRSGTSVGAHYREGRRARSKAEFLSKIQVGLQELEESIYWLELIVESNIISSNQVLNLLKEANELISIFVCMINKIKQ